MFLVTVTMTGITKKEFRYRFGLAALIFFTFFLINPVQEWLTENYPDANFFIIGAAGFLMVLYYFNLER